MADWDWGAQFGDDDDDDNEEGGYQRVQWGTKDGLIFLIDVSKGMFENSGEESNAFTKCIQCAKSVIQNKVIANDKDLLSIIFFGTEKNKNSSDFKHIFVLHDLDLPGAERVLELEALIEEDDNDDFKKKFGHNDGYSISDALWTCSNMFSNCTQKIGFKRVMLFTNNDNPHGNNAQLRRQAAAKAEDLHQNGIEIELMSMKRGGRKFDDNLFYKDILFTDDESTARPDPAERLEELLSKVRAKDHKKRALGRIPFSLGNGLDFSVGVYNLVRQTNAPPRVRLYKKTNEEVKSVTKIFLQETGEVLMPQDMKKAQTFAGKKICFENEEIAEMKKFDTQGVKLLGFKPRSCLKRYFHVKPAQFIYPDESTIEGSTTAFSALLKKCLDRDVIPIVNYIPRRNTPPRFAALLPQAEELDDQNVQQAPPGFHVIFLPFADDFRKIKYEEDVPRANNEQIDKAKAIVKAVNIKYNPDDFDNPSLQKHYANIEAMALDRDAPEEVEDLTLPNKGKIKEKAATLIESFKDMVFPEGYVPGAKRRAPAGSAAAKKPKFEMEVDIEAEARAGRLSKLTVAKLKDFIKQHKISSDGTKKADLIDAINTHFGI